MGKELDFFLNADWKGCILPRLTAFATKWVRAYSWSTKASLPKGLEIEDLVTGAIEKTLAGLNQSDSENRKKGIRRWNSEKCPELLAFLMGVVKSDISALAKSHDHQRTDRGDDEGEDASEIVDLDFLSDDRILPENNSRYEALVTSLKPLIADDNEAQQIVTATEELINSKEDPTSETVMQLTGFTYVQYRNARRRLLSAVKTLMETKKGGI